MVPQHLVVLGATGNIGSQLTHALLAQGYHVTAVARTSARLDALQQAGASTAPGDVRDVNFLTQALGGADGAFLLLPPNVQAPDVLADMRQSAEIIAEAVRAAGLRRAVSLSSDRAHQPLNNGPLFLEQEARLDGIAGLHVAHLRPAFFMDNLLAQIGLIKRLGSMATAMRPDLHLPMVATKDIAAKAAELLGGGAFENHSRHCLLGPRDYSMQEAAAIIGPAIGQPDLRYLQTSYEQARQGLLHAGMSASMADLFEEMVRTSNASREAAGGERTAASATPTTLEEFARTVFAPAFQRAQ